MTGSETDRSVDDLWPVVEAVGSDLDRVAERLADPLAAWDESDAEHVDSIVMVVEDLRANAAGTNGRHEDGDVLADLYESPISAGGFDDVLAELSHRAGLTQEQAWQRVGRAIPQHLPPEPLLADALHVVPLDIGWGLGPEANHGGDTVVAPAQTAAEPTDARSTDWWGVVVEVLTVVGVLIFVFVIYAVYGTGLAGARSQRFLEREFEAQLRASVSLGEGAIEQDSGLLGQPSETPAAGDEEDQEGEEAFDPTRQPSAGEAIAVLSIPTIGVRDVVVEGTRADELMNGPGHLRSSPVPGRAGNSVIFGRRTTYGGPFSRLDDLQPGDPLDVVTTQGLFRYVVQVVDTVDEGEPDPITATFSNRLTLVTSDEKYATTGRLIVFGLLEGAPVPTPLPDGATAPIAPIVNDDELATERSGVDWALAILWTQGLVAVYFGTKWLYRHWLPWSTWLVSAPVFVLFALAWLDSLARLFPSTL